MKIDKMFLIRNFFMISLLTITFIYANSIKDTLFSSESELQFQSEFKQLKEDTLVDFVSLLKGLEQESKISKAHEKEILRLLKIYPFNQIVKEVQDSNDMVNLQALSMNYLLYRGEMVEEYIKKKTELEVKNTSRKVP